VIERAGQLRGESLICTASVPLACVVFLGTGNLEGDVKIALRLLNCETEHQFFAVQSKRAGLMCAVAAATDR
jgi:hypothetical protein